MTIHYSKHKHILLQILKDIFSDTSLSPYLGFKGGTAALLFYGLDRYSVDIDLDLIDVAFADTSKKEYTEIEQHIFEKIHQIAQSYGKIVDARIKRFNMIIIIAHDEKSQNIKIEVNRRQFGSRYTVQTLLGVSMPVMVREDMFAHKLMAMYERIGKTSRDIYDVHFFAKHNWPINKDIVEARSNMSFADTVEQCIILLERMNKRHVLDGLGELLTSAQKDWAREKLLGDTIFVLRSWLESERPIQK